MSEAQTALPRPTAIPTHVYLIILVGVLATSFAAIFIRFAQSEGVPSLAIAAGRLSLAALILTPFVLRRHLAALRALSRGELLLAAVSGALLAVHFASWIVSLEYTSVLISVVLVCTSPLWVALLERLVFRARLHPSVLAGLLIAVAGGVLIGVGGSGSVAPGRAPLLGGLLALAGAVAMACYLVIGRRLRAKLSLLPYVWLVYSCAAGVLLGAVALTHTPLTGYDAQSYLWIVLLALVPQLIGHSSLNYALHYLSATYVSIATQMEPIGSAVAAFLFFNEQPAALQVVGSAAILAGVIIAGWVRRPAPEPHPPAPSPQREKRAL